jgi:aminomuconate-semialdehyde/2-hydroxymuconate-6-semialdehyde dehydrogenase
MTASIKVAERKCYINGRFVGSGISWVNCWFLRDLRTPFGGVKLSGIGREGGLHSLNFYSEPTNICIKL